MVVDEVRDNKEPGCGGPSKSLWVNLGVFEGFGDQLEDFQAVQHRN